MQLNVFSLSHWMRILLAFDKFKGSLTARQASEAVVRGLRKSGVTFAEPVEICPIADGGEGFTDAVLTAMGGLWQEVPTHDAHGREIVSKYGRIGPDAIMEMSSASGLALVLDLPLDPSRANTRGTGEMMLHAVAQGAKRIIIGIGGSATNDGGSGMAAALGVRFLDRDGVALTNFPADLDRVERLVQEAPLNCEVIVACDVTNPLLGEQGATAVYGPQKGVKDIPWFESRLEKLAALVERDLGHDSRHFPGAGAAGGLGFGLMSFCGARLQSGFDLVADMTNLKERIAKADLVITGEGRLDSQTLNGKGPAGVARLAREAGRRVVGVGGIVEKSAAVKELFDHVVQVKPEHVPVREAMQRAEALLEEAAALHAEAILGQRVAVAS